MSTKGVLLIGGPNKGTRFRPFDVKPLFPIAGKPMLWHQVQALSTISSLTDVLIIGVYEDAVLADFIKAARREFPNISITYLREFRPLGTAGGLYHFRDSILKGNPQQIFVLNSDICSSFPLRELQDFHSKHRGVGTIMIKEVPKGSEHRFGCVVVDQSSAQALHYVEKPESFISNKINTGIYLFDQSIFAEIKHAMEEKLQESAEDPLSSEPDDIVHLEQDVITRLAANRKLYAYETKEFWRQIKSAGSALPANALYLQQLSKSASPLLTPPCKASSTSPEIVGAVSIHPTASISPSAKLGPNVSIGPHVTISSGCRVTDSILLEGSTMDKNSVAIWAIVGEECRIGAWARVEGAPEDVLAERPNKAVAILANDVTVAKEVNIRSCIVLPHKILTKSATNEVLL